MLYCGAARECITPSKELLGSLSGLGGRHFSGVIVDDIFVRVIAFKSGSKTALIVAFDLDKVPYPERILEKLTKAAGIAEESIMLFSTHIHTAPVCGRRPDEPMNDSEKRAPNLRKADEKYIEFLGDCAVSASTAAIKNMNPARVGWNEGESYINVNRVQDFYAEGTDGPEGRVTSIGVNFDGPVDHKLWVMRAETLEGEPIAFMMNYAVHNVAMIWNDSDGKGNIAVSSDIGGNVSQMLEKRYPDAVAVWSSGAAGDVNPVMYNEYTIADENTGLPTSLRAKGMDAALLALKVMSHRHYADVLSVLRSVQCAEDVELKGCAVGWTHTPGRICRGTPEGEEVLTGEGIPTYDVREQMLLLGDVAVCGFSGELYTTLGWQVKKALIQAHVVTVNHNCSLMANSGYIFDDDAIRRIDSSVRHMHIPGYGTESHILPGHVAPALGSMTERLYKEICGKNVE